MFKPFRFIPDDTKIAFMRFARFGFYVSMVLCVVSIGLFFTKGLNYGIDFKGGTLIEIKTQGPADLGDLRKRIGSLGLGDTELQEFGQPNDVLMHIQAQPGGDAAQQDAVEKVKASLPKGIDYRRIEVVGPKVSGELARDGTIAVVVAMIGVLIYIWFRFEWQFAFGAVASLIHDVTLTIGLFSILRITFDLSIIAAILTIVGYSLNDTVVVFDRFRENLRRYKQKPLGRDHRSVAEPDPAAHHHDLAVHAGGVAGALYLRRRGDPRLHFRHDLGRSGRHLLVDLHRRPGTHLPRRPHRHGERRYQGRGGKGRPNFKGRQRVQSQLRPDGGISRHLEYASAYRSSLLLTLGQSDQTGATYEFRDTLRAMARRQARLLSGPRAHRCLWQFRLPLRRHVASRLHSPVAGRHPRLGRRQHGRCFGRQLFRRLRRG